MQKPVLLDIGCRQGGATRGYQNAGFYVIGVDIEPQPRYIGDHFVQADGLSVLKTLVNLGRLWLTKIGLVRPAALARATATHSGSWTVSSRG